MASGVGVHPTCVEEFINLKLRKTYSYIIYVIDGENVVIEDKGKASSEEFVKKLPKDDCRFGVFDAGSKIHFVLWTPEISNVRSRMIYTTSKDALHKKLDGVTPVALTAHDHQDFLSKLKEASS